MRFGAPSCTTREPCRCWESVRPRGNARWRNKHPGHPNATPCSWLIRATSTSKSGSVALTARSNSSCAYLWSGVVLRMHGPSNTICSQTDHSARAGVLAGVMPDARNTAQMLREKAERCRRLAGATTDAEVGRKLLGLAEEFEEQARAEEAGSCSR